MSKDDIPPIDENNLPKDEQHTKNLEEKYNEVMAGSESSHKYGHFFKLRADDLEGQLARWENVLIVLFMLVILCMVLSNTWFEILIAPSLKRSLISLGIKEELSSNQFLLIYCFSKISILGFLITIFIWISRIYNQIRRLKITYKDKYIIAVTSENFIQNSRDDESRSLIKEYAYKALFSLTLEQAETITTKTVGKMLTNKEVSEIIGQFIKAHSDK